MNRIAPLAAAAAVAVAAAALSTPEALPAAGVAAAEPAAYGTLDLSAGFSPDPYAVPVRAGGAFDASALGPYECAGYIDAERPDVRVHYAAGGYVLRFFVAADVDTTLAVRTPGGDWLCSDDESLAGGSAPGIVVRHPEDGAYAVWVGTWSASDAGAGARLEITEGGFPWDAGAAPAAAVGTAEPARYETLELSAGFVPDPRAVPVYAGGAFDASALGAEECAGYIDAERPDVRVHYAAGGRVLRFFVAADVDATLAVMTPGGDWLCNDDESPAAGNAPGIVVRHPEDGAYAVWVGTWYASDTGSRARLEIAGGEPPREIEATPSAGVGAAEPARYETLDLTAGFVPDPYEVRVRAGGPFDASALGPNECAGYYFDAERPDVRVHYTAGDYILRFFVDADVDTTLAVRTPGGDWLCNDDESLDGGDAPRIVVRHPENGPYAIWVGSHVPLIIRPAAALQITEGAFPWAPGQNGKGTAFLVSPTGHLLTNHHNVDECSAVTAGWSETGRFDATVVAVDPDADLALLETDMRPSAHAAFRSGAPRQGERVVTFGFPGELATQGNVSVGYVAATLGPGDDEDTIQISAPIQGGSSGSPVADGSGRVVAVVKAALGAHDPTDPPQLVNFAASGSAAIRLLKNSGVPFDEATAHDPLPVPDIADLLRAFTVPLWCD